MKRYWLAKSEPDEYGIDDLKRDQNTLWTGIRNYQVRNMIVNDIKVGDRMLVYHSSTKDKGVMGEMKVSASPVPDPLQFAPDSHYYDKGSDPHKPRWWAVPVAYVATYSKLVTLEKLKTIDSLADSPLTRKGNRLSIIPLTKEQFQDIKASGR